jgi:acetyltransferase-like isoleucine patch superfamily enzyme
MIIFKALRKLLILIRNPFYTPITLFILFLNGVNIGNDLRVRGFLKVNVTRRGKATIGNKFRVNSGNNYNLIGRQQKTILWVEGTLSIGNNVGISSTAIICNHSITIGNNVIIGGNTVIYDTDFHSLDPEIRNSTEDKNYAKKKPVLIMDNVFIGAHSTILKGVTIGTNSIVGACSVVSRDIPSNEIWAGNPACFIKKIKST